MQENGATIRTGHGEGAVITAARGLLDTSQGQAGLSLLFAEGERPSASDIEQLLTSDALSGQRTQITHRSAENEGWLELLANGLTFELLGLAPGEGAPLPAMQHQFGIALGPAQFDFEAVTIVPGEHIAGGAAMLPLVRAMIGLGASIALPLDVKAVCWHPAQSWMEPGYFTRIVVNWLSGGAFPALGLTAVDPSSLGGFESSGLAFFAGQEVHVEALANEARADTVKLTVKVIDHIVRHGRLTSLHELQGPSGETILAEPSHDGRRVRVWRSFA